MLNTLQRLVRTEAGNYFDPADPGEPQYKGSPPRRSVTDEEIGILSRLASDKTVLEIGTGLAVSTRALAATARRVVTVDPDPWVKDPALPNVEFCRAVPEDLTPFDFVFIDGLHTTAAVIQDIERTHPIARLLLHDTYLPDVQAAISQCALVERESWPTRCRLAIYTRN
jgi:hypothetical protein